MIIEIKKGDISIKIDDSQSKGNPITYHDDSDERLIKLVASLCDDVVRMYELKMKEQK